MNIDVVDSVINLLEKVRSKPMVYIGVDLSRIISFLDGVHAVCQTIGIQCGYGPMYEQVMTERGWTYSPKGPWQEMKERGLSDTDIVDEIINIEIEVLRRSNG